VRAQGSGRGTRTAHQEEKGDSEGGDGGLDSGLAGGGQKYLAEASTGAKVPRRGGTVQQ
jgi:hypothetical protein